MDFFKILIYFILICVALFFVHKFLSRFKFPKIGSLTLVTGGVKCGKSTFSVGLAIKDHKRNLRKVKFANFLRKLFRKKPFELPLLYSNVPLNCDYVPLTTDLLERKKRFAYRSTIYIQEASLVADSMLIKDMDLNERLLYFNKLIGHETCGGAIIYDTQCIGDLHYSIKRSTSNYFYIHHITKWIPFFLIAYVQECRYSDDGTVIQAQNQDTEDTLKRVIIPKKVWKKFDSYCYSYLTDNLPVETKLVNGKELKDLKARDIVTFKKNAIK